MIMYWYIRGLIGLCLLGVSVIIVATVGAIKLMFNPPRSWAQASGDDSWT